MRNTTVSTCAELPIVSPAIISASRATDIPAFHMRWFMERLRAGFCVRINPYRNAQRTRISFAACRVIVFWTKDPRPLIPHLKEIRDRGMDCIVQYTLNDYEAEQLEPRVPPLAVRVRAFAQLAEILGPDRVMWRFDPLLVGEQLPVSRVLARIARLGHTLAPYTKKLVFSLLDMYARPAARLRNHVPRVQPPSQTEIVEFAEGLCLCAAQWSQPLQLASCAEEVDLSAWGIMHNACIDPELLMRLHPEDRALAALCLPRQAQKHVQAQEQHVLPFVLPNLSDQQGQLNPPILQSQPNQPAQSKQKNQAGGWRPACRCAPNRDIGVYSSCMHLCVYCYANHSKQAVIAQLNRRVSGCEHV